MRLWLLIAMLLQPFAAYAQDGVRGSDRLLTVEDLQGLIAGQVLEFYDGSKSRYQSDGRYGYTYTDDGPVWTGAYSLGPESEVCVAFDNGSSRCDLIVFAGDNVVLVTTDGLRFPVRNITVADE